MNKKGFLIAVDGTDGSGKGTQTRLLCEALEQNGIPFRYIDFPTYDSNWSALVNLYLGGKFGSDPKAVNAYAASSFYSMDRYCSYMLDWKKDYDDGKVIVANRYTTANAVHQLAKLEKSKYDEFLDWLFDFEQEKLQLPYPDAVFYLALEPKLSIELVEKRCTETGAHKDIHENLSHLTAATNAACYACEKLGWTRVQCSVDGRMRSIESIHREILDKTLELLK